MIPLKQRNLHQPEKGIYGDCHRAAYASLLELPLDDVPHFCDGLDEGSTTRKEREWLAQRGLTNINIIFPGETPLDDVLGTIEAVNPGVMFILGGTSTTGCGHSVIGGRGRILHDPSLTNTGDHSIVGPMKDGYWWLTFIGAAVTVQTAADAAA